MDKFRSLLFVCPFFLLSPWIISTENRPDHYMPLPQENTQNKYPWTTQYNLNNSLLKRIPPPAGFKRCEVIQGSFGDWLRHLPLMDGNPPVKLFNGNLKGNQSAHYALINIDVGKDDLQQCADAVMRLKAEYHYSIGDYKNIHFNFTSGDTASWSKWSKGYRPKITGNKVAWVNTAAPGTSYENFKNYLKTVFTYAGTHSLEKEMRKIPVKEMKPGDVFIMGGFPGHAVIIMDMAVHPNTNEKLFMIAQSYMPAQQIHILKNPSMPNTPWYNLNFGEILETPEWEFGSHHLRRFRM
jgi:hypothetical protein